MHVNRVLLRRCSNHVLYSNRSACFVGKKEYKSSLEDAQKVGALDLGVKHFRWCRAQFGGLFAVIFGGTFYNLPGYSDPTTAHVNKSGDPPFDLGS